MTAGSRSPHRPAIARSGGVLLAVLCGSSAGAQAPGGPTAAAAQEPLTELVVTARRLPSPRLDFAGSLSRLSADTLDLVGATHHAEVLNRIPGVHIQRGSGQESLTAIRSPVLTGPGACGAFLVLEDGLPLRPVGFCNVNELFELNLEQAGAIEVVRGPGPATYGANAVHGIVNVVTPDAASLRPFGAALEAGANAWRRVRLQAATDAVGAGLGFYGVFSRDGGFRAESGFDEAKLNVLADRELAGGTLRLRAAGTWLEQETAGFVQGRDAYRDPQLRRSNPNPESYRDAWSARLAAHWLRAPCEDCADQVRAVVRRSRMEFLQHFLLGQPVERNGQLSLALTAGLARPLTEQLAWQAGVDLELADAELLEIQFGPTLQGPPAARAIRPAGRHYDYAVLGRTAGGFGALEWRPAERWRLGAALRLEHTRYEYENRMLAGNTDESGVPCGFGGCLFNRPADRTDRFTNVVPKVDASFELAPGQRLYAAAARGFRPPEMTELYRLQRQQSFAELSSERLDSIELGWLGSAERLAWSLALYALEKRDVILRDANAFNVSNGRTSHRGIEYELRARPLEWLQVAVGGSIARHRYELTQAVEGGETIVAGNEVDTAPRHTHAATLTVVPDRRLRLELEAQHLGEHFLDAANQHRYPGHTLLNARVRLAASPSWQATLRVTNVLDRRYADRADFAFGNYRYFPGRERAWFVEIAYGAR